MDAPFVLTLATGNPHKAKELEALLSDWSVDLRTAADLSQPPAVIEDQATLEGNARKKAVEWFAAVDAPVLADDTGLEVEALGGRPGVYSARFAGPGADDAANRAALLAALNGEVTRTAQFRTVLAFTEGTTVRLFEGICRGRILTEERGTHGFGYDALFVPMGYERSFAELPPDEKNRISHRGRALEAFVDFLRTYPPAASAHP